MRTLLFLSTAAVLTACGAAGNTPWDQNHDGLITACEGLNPQACDATIGCEPTAMVCTLECRDDGHGGCLPCAAEVCRPRPTPPPPIFDCSQLSLDVCAVTPRCEVVLPPTCGVSDSNGFSDPTTRPAPAPQGGGVCVNRQAAGCESLSNDVCLSAPGCALEGFGAVCEVACDPNGNCPPCAISQLRCVTFHPPEVCGARDLNTCSMDGRCVLEQGPVCDAICSPDGSCPPCAVPSMRCVPAPPVDVCAGRDLTVCEVDGRCAVQAWACPAICKPDGHGGCLPCEAPPAACVPVLTNHCEGLDRLSCQAAGCSLLELACDTACRDDGNGGCLPCDAFICSEGSGSGGGSVPPQP